MQLTPGQNISISQKSPTTRSVTLTLSWEPASTPLELDSSAFALTSAGKVGGDEGFIFYNQPELPGGGIRRSQDGRSFDIAFDRLPGSIERLVVALTVHEGRQRKQSFTQLSRVRAVLSDAQTRQPLAEFPLTTTGMPETALIVAELYRRNNEWKFRAAGQGFVGGLGPLAQQYGVEVADDPDTAPPPPVPAPPKVAAAPTPPTPPAAPVSLAKITLEKKGQKISLEKKGGSFGEIVVNLNWNRRAASSGGGGFMSSLFGGGGNGNIDLDLGCLLQLADGRAGAVQALGDSFGSLNEPPYVQLMGDDRTGASSEGETLVINGRHWDQLRRVLVYAYIYEGVPNWAQADAVVTIKAPNQPTLEVRLDEHRNDRGMCAIALLENVAGSLQVSKRVDYFQNHRSMDEAFGFGLRWVAGSKD